MQKKIAKVLTRIGVVICIASLFAAIAYSQSPNNSLQIVVCIIFFFVGFLLCSIALFFD